MNKFASSGLQGLLFRKKERVGEGNQVNVQLVNSELPFLCPRQQLPKLRLTFSSLRKTECH